MRLNSKLIFQNVIETTAVQGFTKGEVVITFSMIKTTISLKTIAFSTV